MRNANFGRQATALTLALSFLLPTLSGCGSKGNDTAVGGGGGYTAPNAGGSTMSGQAPAPAKQGLSGKQKVVLLAGAALLYYIYKKDIANNNKAAQSGPNGKPQLYREEKGPNTGAIYYRDPQTHKPIWVTAPSQGVQVPADQVQQYAPDYQQYSNQAPQIPAGQRTVPASQYDPSIAGGPPGPGM